MVEDSPGRNRYSVALDKSDRSPCGFVVRYLDQYGERKRQAWMQETYEGMVEGAVVQLDVMIPGFPARVVTVTAFIDPKFLRIEGRGSIVIDSLFDYLKRDFIKELNGLCERREL